MCKLFTLQNWYLFICVCMFLWHMDAKIKGNLFEKCSSWYPCKYQFFRSVCAFLLVYRVAYAKKP